MRAACLALALLLAACGERAGDADDAAGRQSPAEAAQIDSSMALVSRAAAVTLGIREFPASADSVLSASGMTGEEYEDLMYRIAADPRLSDLYLEATGGKR
jgi:hypothetical protein